MSVRKVGQINQMVQNDGNREVLRSPQRFSYQEKLGNSKQEQ
ncbi:hypothetical protein [Helicobacter cinaedi]|uniref:Uncharacterized protein n=1 Tax=Helicobacter cinaedi CCUG 18818 = ATCC BAA-847 TaxID=537971 RepID=A0ABN0BAK9_9HELI|nr:hypothetical protein [Helicobacter cinaedi]EFR45738.1 hypothetical protein HCCG_00284 [Helicobacter cinaedi CCUG 18818 = ATCC BAA-847]BBB20645.1 hypothetical protein HC081234_18220 [Helicobacter cinaedi]